jgi:hypothetical protein
MAATFPRNLNFQGNFAVADAHVACGSLQLQTSPRFSKSTQALTAVLTHSDQILLSQALIAPLFMNMLSPIAFDRDSNACPGLITSALWVLERDICHLLSASHS